MKFSLNHLKKINQHHQSTGDIAAVGTDKLIAKINAQLGAIDEAIDVGSKYQGIVIVKIVSCDKHADADKLSVCKIDDGGVVQDVERDGDGYVQLVCGAPNARAGMLAVWLPPGVTVPETANKEPFLLTKREIRGVVSNGMLASPKELALGDGHQGLLEIPGNIKPGSDFAEVTGFKDDVVLDIENKMFTHRPDLFGWLGIDRELAGIQGQPFKSPGWYVPAPEFPDPEGEELPLSVKNELPEKVPRFTAIAMSDIKVGPSNVWVQAELAKVGQKPINNIVDYTNFFMQLTGQPLHAYDYDKVKALSNNQATIVIRNPKPGEKIKLLNGKQVEPRPETVMIATDKQLIGIGGVMGGADTEVDENTTNVILESANFDMYSVRRTAMEYGLFTDAVTRFTKGQSPLQNLTVLRRIVAEIVEAGIGEKTGKVAGRPVDDNRLGAAVLERGSLYPPVTVAAEFINARLGLKLSGQEMKKLLENVEFKVELNNDELTVTAPFWRTDIELREDLVEEVGRLYGYDHLPLELPQRVIEPTPKDPLLTLKAQIRERLSQAGANEVLTYSFVPGELLEKVGQDAAKAFQIANALSPDLQYYRPSLMPSLLGKVHMNIKAGYDEFALFEIGKTHDLDHMDEDGHPQEFEYTGLVVAANDKLKKAGAPYYQARQYLTFLAGVEVEFRPIDESMRQYQVVQPYELERAALVSIKDGDFLGIIGEFTASTRRNLKLPKYSAGFEIDTTVLKSAFQKAQTYVPLPRFPKVTQDITMRVPAVLSYQELHDFLLRELEKNRPPESLLSLNPVDIYQKEADKDHKNVSFRLTIANYERTLTDKEVNKLLETVAVAAKTKFDAIRI